MCHFDGPTRASTAEMLRRAQRSLMDGEEGQDGHWIRPRTVPEEHRNVHLHGSPSFAPFSGQSVGPSHSQLGSPELTVNSRQWPCGTNVGAFGASTWKALIRFRSKQSAESVAIPCALQLSHFLSVQRIGSTKSQRMTCHHNLSERCPFK